MDTLIGQQPRVVWATVGPCQPWSVCCSALSSSMTCLCTLLPTSWAVYWRQLYQASGNKHVSGLSLKFQHRCRSRTVGPYPSRQYFHALLSRLWSGVISVISLLSSEPYVIVISLNCSKAFDSVRHSSLLYKLVELNLPDHIYNWLADFFSDHSHCILLHDQQSSLLDISASIIQGSAIGPATYVVTAGDRTSCVSGNFLCKYADDTYLIIPASNESSSRIKLVNIENWAKQNNLKWLYFSNTHVI